MSEETGSVDAGNPAEAAPAPAAEAAPANWVSGFEDSDLGAYAEAKGFHNTQPENVVNSYRNLEKLMGADKAGRTFTLPNEGASSDEMNTFYSKIGRPDDAAGYGLTATEGDTSGFADAASAKFHELGISAKQASGLHEFWEGFTGTMQTKANDAQQISRVDAENALRSEWGAAYDTRLANVDKAAAAFGLGDSQLNGLREAMGPVEAMKFVYDLNSKIGDDTFDRGVVVDDGVMTPDQARAEQNKLLGDSEFLAAWTEKSHPGHADAIAKKAGLSRLINGQSA